jgi:hypothetical protein
MFQARIYPKKRISTEPSLSKSDSVRVVVSEGKKRALLLQPDGSNGSDESDERLKKRIRRK